jgi:hypothetical protein
MTTSSLNPTHTIICKVPQSSSEFQTQIQTQRPGRFSNASQRRSPIGRWIKKQTLNILLSMVKLLMTLWMVYQYTQSLQRYRCRKLLETYPERLTAAKSASSKYWLRCVNIYVNEIFLNFMFNTFGLHQVSTLSLEDIVCRWMRKKYWIYFELRL